MQKLVQIFKYESKGLIVSQTCMAVSYQYTIMIMNLSYVSKNRNNFMQKIVQIFKYESKGLIVP